MSAIEEHVYRVHLAEPGGGVAVQDVPTDSFEATERGILLNGTTVVPWHRVIRYVKDVVQPLGEPELMTHAEVRAWLDPSPWTADLLVVEAVNIEAATIHLKKIHVPWGRVLEYERVPLPVKDAVPVRPD
jgi:uncharacterized protein (UPF0248 family)